MYARMSKVLFPYIFLCIYFPCTRWALCWPSYYPHFYIFYKNKLGFRSLPNCCRQSSLGHYRNSTETNFLFRFGVRGRKSFDSTELLNLEKLLLNRFFDVENFQNDGNLKNFSIKLTWIFLILKWLMSDLFIN